MKEIIKNSLWNRMFHKNRLEKQEAKYLDCYHLVLAKPKFLYDLKESKSLTRLLEIHREMWIYGFKNNNLGPNPYGMFRTKDIESMKPEEVYLGGIWGLHTLSIPEWEADKEENMSGNGFGMDPNIKVYELILNQYRGLLLSNLCHIVGECRNYMLRYDAIV